MSQNGAAMTILSAEASLHAMDRAASGTFPKVLSFRVSGVKGGSPMAFTSMVSMSYLAERTSFAASSITLVLDSSLMQESMMMSFSMLSVVCQTKIHRIAAPSKNTAFAEWPNSAPSVHHQGHLPHRCLRGIPACREFQQSADLLRLRRELVHIAGEGQDRRRLVPRSLNRGIGLIVICRSR